MLDNSCPFYGLCDNFDGLLWRVLTLGRVFVGPQMRRGPGGMPRRSKRSPHSGVEQPTHNPQPQNIRRLVVLAAPTGACPVQLGHSHV
eukprot:2926390-Rhodomonas_salina.1